MANFALSELVGKQPPPRILDLGKVTLYRVGFDAVNRYPHAGPLPTQRLNTELVTAAWDDLLHGAALVE